MECESRRERGHYEVGSVLAALWLFSPCSRFMKILVIGVTGMILWALWQGTFSPRQSQREDSGVYSPTLNSQKARVEGGAPVTPARASSHIRQKRADVGHLPKKQKQ